MLYFFYGSDTDTTRAKANALVASLQKKKPDAELFRLDADSATPSRLDELIAGQGLFQKVYLVYTTDLFESEERKAEFLSRLPRIAESPNIFVAREGKLDKETALKISEKAEKVQLFDKKGGKKRPEFDIFSLTDAFGRRNRKKLWVLFQQAVASGAVPEEIHGILFWQVKSILLAHACKTAEEAEVKPYTWSKAQSFAKNWSEAELKTLSSKLITMYHDSHRGIHDFEIALEKMVMTM